MTALAAAVDESGFLQIGDQLADLPWHWRTLT
jgi:hypothetical protein